jgi:hypothetical protein
MIWRRKFRSPEAPGNNYSEVWHSRVIKYVGVESSESRSVKVLECQNDMA